MTNEIKEILDNLKNTDYEKLAKNIENIIDYITNLQQENERLKLELSGYREAILRDDKLLGLQQKIEKAVEYIEENAWYMNKDDEEILDRVGIEGLLKILEGSNNE